MSRMLHLCALGAILILLPLGTPVPAALGCEIWGTVVAEPSDRPDLGSWRYRLLISWDTGGAFALSHMDVILDLQTGRCTCADFDLALNWLDPVGSAMGDPAPCMILFAPELNCDGDPSLGVYDKVLKFEPYPDPACEPGTYGVGGFTLYSDLGPAPIAEPNLFLVDKHGRLACWGSLTGQFPALPCNPVAETSRTWSGVKGVYR